MPDFEHVLIDFLVAMEQAVGSACAGNLLVVEFDTTAVHRQVSSAGSLPRRQQGTEGRGTG